MAFRNSEQIELLPKSYPNRATMHFTIDGEGAPGAQTHTVEFIAVKGWWGTGSAVTAANFFTHALEDSSTLHPCGQLSLSPVGKTHTHTNT